MIIQKGKRMSKFICLDCGYIFDEDEVAVWHEGRGEYWGTPCSETVSGCPRCQGDYVETYQCAVCGEWITDTYIKLNTGDRICDQCYVTYKIGEEV